MILQIALTAAASGFATLIVCLLFFKFYLKAKLEAEIDEGLDRAKLKIKEGMKEEALELLPRFRAEVREGFKEALSAAMGGDVARAVTRPMSTILESSLNLFLGREDKPE